MKTQKINEDIDNEITSLQNLKQEIQTEKSVEQVKIPVQNDFIVHCPGCNVKLNVNVINKNLTLIK